MSRTARTRAWPTAASSRRASHHEVQRRRRSVGLGVRLGRGGDEKSRERHLQSHHAPGFPPRSRPFPLRPPGVSALTALASRRRFGTQERPDAVAALAQVVEIRRDDPGQDGQVDVGVVVDQHVAETGGEPQALREIDREDPV